MNVFFNLNVRKVDTVEFEEKYQCFFRKTLGFVGRKLKINQV